MDQVTVEFAYAYIEIPVAQIAMWWQGVGVIINLVRQLNSLDIASGANTNLAVGKRIPIFTLSLAQAAMGVALGEKGSGMSENTHYATSRAVQGLEQGVNEVNSEVI